MSTVLPLFGIALKLAGVVFLFAAALGVLRFKDALQRMHAATKAGSIGAGLVILGSLTAASDMETVTIGLLAIVFLLFTAPVAGHLLGRAAYISGAPLADFVTEDALKGVLARNMQPAEAPSPISQIDTAKTNTRAVSEKGKAIKTSALARVRFAIISPGETDIARRAMEISKATGLPLDAYAVADTVTADSTADAHLALQHITGKLQQAVANVQAIASGHSGGIHLFTLEGDPEKIIASTKSSDHLLILPHYGYCHHGVDLDTPQRPGRPDGLLRLAELHRGPVLLTAGPQPNDTDETRIIVFDDGAEGLPVALAMAIVARLWRNPKIDIVADQRPQRLEAFRSALAFVGVQVSMGAIPAPSGSWMSLPERGANCTAVIISGLPRPLRTNWYGREWLDHFGPRWSGDVLLAPR